jgi:ATP-dependent helicase/nuclease subunit A
VRLDEAMGLCPKITPPGAERNYPGLTHGLARRRERRELRGEELRLGYVALTRARDHLILVGTSNRKADAAGWRNTPPAALSTATVTKAQSHLEWLLMWLPHVTAPTDWADDWNGENDLLRWRICDAGDPVFAGNTEVSPPRSSGVTAMEAPPGALEALRSRIEWRYPFAAATIETAKTSVTALRRRASLGEEFEPDDLSRPFPASDARTRRGRLTAAAAGVAHHAFLEHVALERTGSEAELRTEAERLRAEGRLSAEETGALDFVALSDFWQSETGRRIRARAGCVKRELAFTARFEAAELEALAGTGRSGVAGPDDFVVVQGVADLVALLPEEIWLVDFKTDEVNPGGLAAKTKLYEPQLKLYALALARIHRRPVTDCRLCFLTARQTVGIEIPAGTTPG